MNDPKSQINDNGRRPEHDAAYIADRLSTSPAKSSDTHIQLSLHYSHVAYSRVVILSRRSLQPSHILT